MAKDGKKLLNGARMANLPCKGGGKGLIIAKVNCGSYDGRGKGKT